MSYHHQPRFPRNVSAEALLALLKVFPIQEDDLSNKWRITACICTLTLSVSVDLDSVKTAVYGSIRAGFRYNFDAT